MANEGLCVGVFECDTLDVGIWKILWLNDGHAGNVTDADLTSSRQFDRYGPVRAIELVIPDTGSRR